MKTLYLHIGQPKTGTTTLQHFCAENRAALNRLGYDYPASPLKYRYVNPWRNGHFLLGHSYYDKREGLSAENQSKREQGYLLLEEWFESYDNIVLSDEALWTDAFRPEKPFWGRLMQHAREHGYEVKVIVYLRRQDQFAQSYYVQSVKEGGATQCWEEWLQTLGAWRLDYFGNLEAIARYTGREAIDVRVYDRAALDAAGGIHADFLSALGICMDDTFVQLAADENVKAPNFNAVAIKLAINTSPHFDRSINKLFGEAMFYKTPDYETPPAHWALASEAETRHLLAKYVEGNSRIATCYRHEDGPLFSTEVQPAEKWRPDNPCMFDDLIAYFLRLNVLQNKQVRKRARHGGRHRAAVDTCGERMGEWQEHFSKVFVHEEGVGINVARCMGEFFVLRQRDLKAGVRLRQLDRAAVVNMLFELQAISKRMAAMQAELDTHRSARLRERFENWRRRAAWLGEYAGRAFAHPLEILTFARRRLHR